MSKEPQKRVIKRVTIDTENAAGRTMGEIRSSGFMTEEEKRLLFEAVNSVLSVIQAPEYQELLKDAEERERILLPFVEKVLKDPKNRRKYKGITAAEVLENMDIMGRVVNPGEISAEILKKAEKKKRAQAARDIQKEKQSKAQEQEQEKPAQVIKYEQGDTLQTTGTKLANEFFSIAPPITEIDGQLTLNTVYTSKSGKDIAVLSYYNFNDAFLKKHGIESRNFSDFDYFVAMVCNNLYLENNRQVSLTKIWHEMGNPHAPSAPQLRDLREALLKGLSTILHISNKEVLEAWKIENDSYRDIESPVIPVQILTDRNKASGNIMNETINIYALSPFILVADPLHQIQTWDKQILKLYPGSRSGRYWRVMHYLMREIAWIRNDTARSNKITIDHLCAAVGDKTRADRQRTLKLTYELLDTVFIPLDYISSYKTDNKDGGIIVRFNKERKPKLGPGSGKNQK